MISILDKRFKYVSSHATDIRKTFARVRREQERDARDQGRVERSRLASSSNTVTPLPKRVA